MVPSIIRLIVVSLLLALRSNRRNELLWNTCYMSLIILLANELTYNKYYGFTIGYCVSYLSEITKIINFKLLKASNTMLYAS